MTSMKARLKKFVSEASSGSKAHVSDVVRNFSSQKKKKGDIFFPVQKIRRKKSSIYDISDLRINNWTEQTFFLFLKILSYKKDENTDRVEFNFEKYFKKKNFPPFKLDGVFVMDLTTEKIKDIFNDFTDDGFLFKIKSRFHFYIKLIQRYKIFHYYWVIYEMKMKNLKLNVFRVPILQIEFSEEKKFANSLRKKPPVYDEYFDDIPAFYSLCEGLFNKNVMIDNFVNACIVARGRRYRKTKIHNSNLKVSVIVSDTVDEGESVNPVVKLLSRRLEYGVYHSEILIGPWIIHWTQGEVVVPKNFTEARSAMFSFEVQKREFKSKDDLKQFISGVVDVVVDWNLNYTYSTSKSKSSVLSPLCSRSGNCQHFVLEVLEILKKTLKLNEKDISLSSDDIVDEDRKILWQNIKNKLKKGDFTNEIEISGDKFLEVSHAFIEYEKKVFHKEIQCAVGTRWLGEMCEKMRSVSNNKKKKKVFKTIFTTHLQVDQFMIVLRDGGMNELKESRPMVKMLKAYDRGFWLKFYKVEKLLKQVHLDEVKKEKLLNKIVNLKPLVDEDENCICFFREPYKDTFLARNLEENLIPKYNYTTSGTEFKSKPPKVATTSKQKGKSNFLISSI